MASPIQNVTLVGASGKLGTIALEKLSASRFNLQVLRRLGSTSTLPASVKVVDLDFTSVKALTVALKGQDAVISTLAGDGVPLQRIIIDAAIAAGVRRFLPSEWGSNLDNELSRQLPIFTDKVKIQQYLREKAATDAISYTVVYTGPFLDWGIQSGILLNIVDNKAHMLDDGEAIFSTTNIDTIGCAVVSILEHLDETKNRSVFLEDLKVSQKHLLGLAKQAAPEKTWEVTYTRLEDLVKVASKQHENGVFNLSTVLPFLHKCFMTEGYGSNFEETDNKLLGLGTSSDGFVLEQYKKLLS